MVKEYTSGRLLPRGQIFTLFNDKHREQMITIFESLFFAEDWDTFFRTACYARDRVNEGQFIYALSVAVLHREDTRGIVLPPAYEIYPHLFVNSEVIHAAYKAKMRQEPAVVRMNFTGKREFPDYPYSHLLSKNLKIKICKTIILQVVLYGCETWSLTLREEQRLRMFRNRELRRIFGPKREEVAGDWTGLHNEELHNLYASSDIISVIKSRSMNWAGNVARMGNLKGRGHSEDLAADGRIIL